MRRVALVVLAITFAATARAWSGLRAQAITAGPPTPRGLRIVITTGVFDELDRLADTLPRETVRCLIGAKRGDTVLIDLAWPPPIEHSTRHGVRYQSCPVATIALWHNHLRPATLAAPYACYLSETDIREALEPHAPPVQIVQVNAEVMCWWSRSQITGVREEPILWPLPSQRRGKHVTVASTCDGASEPVPCALIRDGPGSDHVGPPEPAASGWRTSGVEPCDSGPATVRRRSWEGGVRSSVLLAARPGATELAGAHDRLSRAGRSHLAPRTALSGGCIGTAGNSFRPPR